MSDKFDEAARDAGFKFGLREEQVGPLAAHFRQHCQPQGTCDECRETDNGQSRYAHPWCRLKTMEVPVDAICPAWKPRESKHERVARECRQIAKANFHEWRACTEGQLVEALADLLKKEYGDE
jgi:hypothetical protein